MYVRHGTKHIRADRKPRTSENSVKRKSNFRESPEGEVRRIPLLGTSVNKGKKEGRHVPAHHPKLLVTGKRSQNLDFVLGGDRHQSLHVGWLRWRYAQLLGR